MRRALFVLCVLGTVVTAAVPAPALSARAAQQGTVQQLDDKDAEVFMKVKASASEIAAVRRAIRQSPVVREWAFVSKDAAYEEFKRIFRKKPKMVKGMKPADLPVSFRVRLRSPEDSIAQFDFDFSSRRGVDVVKSAIITRRSRQCSEGLPDGDLEVFMPVGASESQVASVRAALDADPETESISQVTTQQALEITQCIFTGVDGIDRLTADDLPTSFLVDAVPTADLERAYARLSAIPGVDKVTFVT